MAASESPPISFSRRTRSRPTRWWWSSLGRTRCTERSSANVGGDLDRFSFIMRSGRAFLYPIYKSTFERGDGLKNDDSQYDDELP